MPASSDSPTIPAGRYAIEVRARGFAPGKAEVLVEAGRSARTMMTLPLGQISEAETVHGAKPATGSLAPAAPAASAVRRAPQRIPVGGNVQPAKLIEQSRSDVPGGPQAAGYHGYGHVARGHLENR